VTEQNQKHFNSQ